jgi:hypothetical protein
MGDSRGAYRILVEKPEEKKKLLGRPRRRREENMKMYLQEVGWEGLEWIALTHDRDRWWALVNAGNCLTS